MTQTNARATISRMSAFTIHSLSSYLHWVDKLLNRQWGSTLVVTRGKIHVASQLPGFFAFQNGEPVGLVTFNIDGDHCEIVTLNSLLEGVGIGSALIAAVRRVAVSSGCQRLWLITTNDNLKALRFYQKRGFVLVAVHRNALEQSRKIKPQIPLTGLDGIPLRDEIELEQLLSEPKVS